MARMKESTEYLRRTFTVEENLKMAQELAGAHNRLADIKKDKEVAVAQFKDKQLQVEQSVEKLSRDLSTGFEMSNIKCRLEYDKPNVNEVQYIRIDTGEVVKTRAMLPDEIQQELPFEPRTEEQAEQVVEQSQAAADDFFGPGRVENPTAETAAPIVEDTRKNGWCENCEKNLPVMVVKGAGNEEFDLCDECRKAHEARVAAEPSAADLDAVAAEETAAEATAAPVADQTVPAITTKSTKGKKVTEMKAPPAPKDPW